MAFAADPCSRLGLIVIVQAERPLPLLESVFPVRNDVNHPWSNLYCHHRENTSEKSNAGYRDLLAQRAALDEQIEALRSVERGEVIDWIFEQMALFQSSLKTWVPGAVRKSTPVRLPPSIAIHNQVLHGPAAEGRRVGWQTRIEKNS